MTSCKEGTIDNPEVDVVKVKNRDLELISKALAMTLQESPRLRALLKEQALKKFDFQYDVLYERIAGEPLESMTVKEHLKKNFETLGASKDFESAVQGLHYLQFSVPVHIDSWDAKQKSPLVVVLPVDRDEKSTSALKAYDGNLQEHTLSAKVPPTDAVICVGESERIDENGMLMVTQDGILLPHNNRLLFKLYCRWWFCRLSYIQ